MFVQPHREFLQEPGYCPQCLLSFLSPSCVVKVPPVRNDVLSVIFSISPQAVGKCGQRGLYLSNVIAPFSICPSNCHTPIGTGGRPPPLAAPE